jgi:thiol-disulfide isomerase/thioredoxin
MFQKKCLNLACLKKHHTPMNLNAVYTLALASIILISCTKSEDFSNFLEDDTVAEIEIGLVYRLASLRNQDIPFFVFDEDGTDISADAIFYVNGDALDGNIFTSATEGTYEIYAEYNTQGITATTETESFTVVIPKRKVSIEDHTGTWCGYCPRVTEAIEEVKALTENITKVAIHNNDEMALPFEELIREEFEVFGFPTGRINRTTNWAPPYQIEDVITIAGTNSTMGIGIKSSIDEGILNVSVSISSEDVLNDKKLVVYITEDGILSDQTNYLNNDESSIYFGQGDPIVDFVHDDVLRASLTDIFGNNIPATAALEEYTTTLSTTLDPAFVIGNLKVVVMVTEDDNTTINSQQAKVNEIKGYE